VVARLLPCRRHGSGHCAAAHAVREAEGGVRSPAPLGSTRPLVRGEMSELEDVGTLTFFRRSQPADLPSYVGARGSAGIRRHRVPFQRNELSPGSPTPMQALTDVHETYAGCVWRGTGRLAHRFPFHKYG